MAVANNKKVIIIGAGVAGLALANVLRHQGVPFQVFERDISHDVRPQGWSLTLHFALNLLKDAIDPVKFATLGSAVAVDPEHPHSPFALVDGNAGERRAVIDALPDNKRIRTNRSRLRNWLLQDIDVHWNKTIESYTINDDGVRATFTDGTVEYGGVLVGADGVNSRVCRQLIGSEAFETSTVSYDGQYLACSYWISKELREEIKEKFSPAYLAATMNAPEDTEHSYCLFISLTDVDYTRDKPYDMLWGISCKHEDMAAGSSAKLLEQAKDWTRRAQLHGALRQLVEETPEDTLMMSFHLRERSPHSSLDNFRGPIALIGDAAHTVTQFSGEGGNHGVQDAVLLGMLLGGVYSGEKTLTDAISEYYTEMAPRGRGAVSKSHTLADLFHGPRSDIAAMMNSAAAAQESKTQNRDK
ncbi:hypothetical protein BJV82DRAFT_616010 [Fennellomyces sp. T-0311]|nr:hypothetical protein BJV82DRAFT_616010 [Fennellomyces sp. T-0311]